MNKERFIGSCKEHGYVYVTVKLDRLGNRGDVGPKLSITGRTSRGSYGQIDESLAGVEWTAQNGDIPKLLEIWERWHLNDMRAGCQHQRSWPVTQELTLTPLTWGTEFHRIRELASSGRLTRENYAIYGDAVSIVESATLGFNTPKHEALWSQETKLALAFDWLKAKGTKVEKAGWVWPEEHPEGLLCKPCQVCGYRYGSAWLYEPLPDEVMQWAIEWCKEE